MPIIDTLKFGPEALVDPAFFNECGESPFWHPEERAFYWCDIPRGRIHRMRLGGMIEAWQLPEKVACIARRRPAGLIASCETGIFEVDLRSDGEVSLSKVATVTHPFERMRFNDGRCDRQGRLWVSTMMSVSSERQPVGRWYRYSNGELFASSIGGLTVPNGLAFSPDGKTMYMSDSAPSVRTIWAFDYDIDDGMPSNRRVFVDMRDFVGRPDGATIDCDGGYWICCVDDGCILRFTPEGKLDRRVDLPMQKPTMAAFGGDDRKTLFVTSLCRGADDKLADKYAGCMTVITPGVMGLPEPVFLG